MNAFFFFFFYKCQKFSLYIIILYQQVVSGKAATKQVNQMQNRLIEKNIHGERSAEFCCTGRKVQKEEPLTGLLNRETAQVRSFLLLLFSFVLH